MRQQIAPELEGQIIVMLEAGHSISAASKAFGVPYDTVRKLKRRNNVQLGSRKEELIEGYRRRMAEALSSEHVKEQAAALVIDEIVTAQKLRLKLNQLLESLPERPESTKEAVTVARAYSAIATAMKASNDTLRATLRLGAQPEQVEELPQLVVREMTADEVYEMRKAQEEEYQRSIM